MNPPQKNDLSASGAGFGPGQNPLAHGYLAQGSFEETLRVIANVPVPAGLEDRVRRALRSAPRENHVLAWPTGLRSLASSPIFDSGWMMGWSRTAAAAAIVFVVAGGGWGIYSHVQQGLAHRAIVLPHGMVGGGFSSAGAIRTPQSLNGPVVNGPVLNAPVNGSLVSAPATDRPLNTSATQAKVKTKHPPAVHPAVREHGAAKISAGQLAPPARQP